MDPMDAPLHRNSTARHTLNISPSKAPQPPLQRTAVRSSDLSLGRRVKVPPQVPKRTSSIPREDGSEEGLVAEVASCSSGGKTVEASPVWKRKSLVSWYCVSQSST